MKEEEEDEGGFHSGGMLCIHNLRGEGGGFRCVV